MQLRSAPLSFCFATRRFILFLFLCSTAGTLRAAERVFYVGQSGETRFYGNLPLSDGTLLVGGAAANLDWVPQGTPVTQLSLTAENGTVLHTENQNPNVTAFLLHLSADASQVLRVLRFPHGSVFNVTHIKTETVPGAATGNIFISGQRGSTGGTGGYFIARLNANFLTGVPTAARYYWNIDTRGRGNDHGVAQPWDVYNDGRIIAQTGAPYEHGWGEIIVLDADPGPEQTLANHFPRIPQTAMPGFRAHVITNGSETNDWFWGTADELPQGYSIVHSRMVLKTQATGVSGSQRSFTPEDFHRWQRDENGFWRRGTYPLDAFWWDHWWVPGGGPDNRFAYHARGYTGYRLAGLGNTEGSPYTPRVAAIIVDRRNNSAYIGLNWHSRLPATNNPDFEPALIALDAEGYTKWWARLYREYNDNSAEGPRNLPGTVSQVPGTTQIRSTALVGESIDLSRITSGSDGFIGGYRRLYWLPGSANFDRAPSEITAFDPATGTLTFRNAPDRAVQPGDPFLIDGTVMSRTHTSTPDQYIDALAIDYSTPLDSEGEQGILFVGARAHGNNVVSFWRGHEIAANPGGNGFVNQFTGSSGNIHQTWLGKYRDEGSRATILAATYVAEYAQTNDFGDGNALGPTDRNHANHDFWPNQNGGWPDRNTTRIGARMNVNSRGQLILHGHGRMVQTTANAFHRNIRPYIAGTVSAAASTTKFTAADMIGANLILTNCRVRMGGQIRSVTAFNNDTGEFTVDPPLSAPPTVGSSFRVDEGVANWGNFVRVYSSDLSRLEYSTLLSSQINPVDGSGVWRNSQIYGVWPVGDNILVSGYHADAAGNALPTANLPSWGGSAPIAQSDTAFLAILDPAAELPQDAPPEILQHPESQSRMEGEAVSFSVTVTASPAPQFQWYHDGQALDGANGPVLHLQQVTLAHAGGYHVVVWNGVEPDAVSDTAQLTVTASPGGVQLALYPFTHGVEGFSPSEPSANLTAAAAANAGGLSRFTTNEAGAVNTLSVINSSTRTDVNAAFEHQEYFTITLTPDPGFALNLTRLEFKVSRGGTAGTRHYAVRSSRNPAANLIAPRQPAASRGSWDDESVDLTTPEFQNLTGPVTFMFIVATDSLERSLEWDDIRFFGRLGPEDSPVQISMNWISSGEPRFFVHASIPREYLLESRISLLGEEDWTPIGSWQVPDAQGQITLPDAGLLDHPVLFLRVRAKLLGE